jgi:hypothetical protein
MFSNGNATRVLHRLASNVNANRSWPKRRRQEQFTQQEKRDAEQRAHERRMAELEADLARERETIRYAREAEERKRALQQKQMDVDMACGASSCRYLATSTSYIASRSPPFHNLPVDLECGSYSACRRFHSKASALLHQPRVNRTIDSEPAPKPKPSAAKEEWERQKRLEGAVNPPIDAIMAMTGLEDVKKQVLRIKTKVETSTRQGTDLKGERFNIAMLGNPGTGMIQLLLLCGATY